jgi:PAS domain S-box-containing protein
MKKNTPSKISNQQSFRVLMIDDLEDDEQLIIRELKKGGYNPVYERVETAAAMKKTLKEKQWDIILCDYKMPEFNAPSAIAVLKETNINIPLIIVSGTIGEDVAIECMRLGAQDYIMKSNLSRLCPAIARELKEAEIRNKQMQAELQREAVLEKLRQSEEKYRTILENIEDGYFEVDLAGNLTFFNDSVCRVIGYSREELMGMNNMQYTSKEELKKVFQAYNKVYLTGEPNRELVWQITRKDGTKRYIEGSISLLKDSSGKPAGFRGIARDITERKRAEKILIENEERLRGITHNLPGIIFQFYAKDSGEYGVNYISEPEGEISGIIGPLSTANMDALFPLLLSHIHEEDRERFLTSIKTAVETKTPWNFEGRVTTLSDKMIWIQGLSIPTRHEDQLVFNGILLNITECKQAEEKSRFSEEKFHKIFMATPDCIAITRMTDGLLIDANKRYEEILGWRRQKVIGKKDADPKNNFWVDPSGRDLMVEDLRAGRDILNREFEFRRRDGSVRTGIYSARSIIIDEEECLIFIMRDITEHQKRDEELRRTLDSLKKAVGTTIQVLVSALEARDPYTAGHQSRSADLACAIATEMGLSQDKIEGIHMAGMIHDIGKLSIPAEILTKPTTLTNIEFSLIKEHSQSGYEMLKNVESPWSLAEIVHQHHERMNGTGYPKKLKGDEILIESRILAVADVVEAMASHRPYRASLGVEAALGEIEKNKGILYDDAVADACLKLFKEKGYRLK